MERPSDVLVSSVACSGQARHGELELRSSSYFAEEEQGAHLVCVWNTPENHVINSGPYRMPNRTVF